MLLLQALSGAAKTLEAARAARRLGPKAIARHVAKDTAKEAVKDYFDANGDEKKGGGGGGGAAAAAGGGSQWVELSPEDVAACAEAKVGRDIAKDGDRFWCAAAAPAAFGAGMTVIDASPPAPPPAYEEADGGGGGGSGGSGGSEEVDGATTVVLAPAPVESDPSPYASTAQAPANNAMPQTAPLSQLDLD